MRAQQRAIPPEFCVGNYEEDKAFRGTVHRWLADIWEEKDAQIAQLLTEK